MSMIEKQGQQSWWVIAVMGLAFAVAMIVVAVDLLCAEMRRRVKALKAKYAGVDAVAKEV